MVPKKGRNTDLHQILLPIVRHHFANSEPHRRADGTEDGHEGIEGQKANHTFHLRMTHGVQHRGCQCRLEYQIRKHPQQQRQSKSQWASPQRLDGNPSRLAAEPSSTPSIGRIPCNQKKKRKIAPATMLQGVSACKTPFTKQAQASKGLAWRYHSFRTKSRTAASHRLLEVGIGFGLRTMATRNPIGDKSTTASPKPHGPIRSAEDSMSFENLCRRWLLWSTTKWLELFDLSGLPWLEPQDATGTSNWTCRQILAKCVWKILLLWAVWPNTIANCRAI